MPSDMLGAEVDSVSCALFTMGCVSDVSIWGAIGAPVALRPPKGEVLIGPPFISPTSSGPLVTTDRRKGSQERQDNPIGEMMYDDDFLFPLHPIVDPLEVGSLRCFLLFKQQQNFIFLPPLNLLLSSNIKKNNYPSL